MLTPSWLWTWWRIFGRTGARRLRVALFTNGPKLVGVAPLLTRPFVYRPGIPYRRLELLASGEPEEDEVCSEYLGVVSERGCEQAVVSSLTSALSQGTFGKWDEIVFPSMAADAPIPEMLARAFSREGWSTETATSGACPYVALPANWDEYTSSLSTSGRYVLRRSLRDFSAWADGTEKLHEARTRQELAQGMRILRSLHAERWGDRGAFRSRRFSDFHDAVARALFAENALELSWLEVRSEPIAIVYNVVWRGKVYFYQGGRKVDLPRGIRPGIVLHARAIQRAIEMRRREYDFLAGPSRYKRQLSTNVRPLVHVRAVRAPLRELARRAADRGFDGARYFRTRLRAVSESLSESVSP